MIRCDDDERECRKAPQISHAKEQVQCPIQLKSFSFLAVQLVTPNSCKHDVFTLQTHIDADRPTMWLSACVSHAARVLARREIMRITRRLLLVLGLALGPISAVAAVHEVKMRTDAIVPPVRKTSGTPTMCGPDLFAKQSRPGQEKLVPIPVPVCL